MEDLTETKKTQGEEDLTETIKSQGFVINISNACFWDCSQCCQLISDIESWWIQAYPIIEQIAAVAGAITGTAAITSWIRYKLSKNQKGKELMWVKVILSKEEWNTSVLASLLGLPEDEVKTILKGFGYI